MTSRDFKTCRVCATDRPIHSYGTYTGRSGQVHRKTCNPCRRTAEALRYKNNPEVRSRMKARARTHQLVYGYGITESDYETILSKQGGVCAICGGTQTKRFNVDHCHDSGKVRGLLCWNCNIAIGYMKDDSTRLINAANYLKHHGK